ncbi:hypothetical protein [Okeania sp. SIO2B3]|uniref:hypothetical protein n=1 Tax=Okeania sp. SIO2B3 TaxID=2607784 RepID=UPI0013C1931C|nr:hypothetical protein [Okeania sp. SIO2B3]NET44993.1 hypothetical protein [Okeania sp. SIO2B3]
MKHLLQKRQQATGNRQQATGKKVCRTLLLLVNNQLLLDISFENAIDTNHSFYSVFHISTPVAGKMPALAFTLPFIFVPHIMSG